MSQSSVQDAKKVLMKEKIFDNTFCTISYNLSLIERQGSSIIVLKRVCSKSLQN